MIVSSIFLFDEHTLFPGVMALLPVGGAFLILVTAPSPNNLIERLLSQRVFVGIGLISYSLYLWHQPVFVFARHLDVPFDQYTYGLIAMTFALAWGSYKWIETPCRNRRFLSRQHVFIGALIGSLLMMAAGGYIVYKQGFITHYSAEDQQLLHQYASLDGYNQARFDSMLLQDFDKNGKRKIMLIGDSYGKDLVNVIYEGGMDQDYQFSTKQINGECGNLAGFTNEELEPYIPVARQERCKVIGRYDRDKIDHLLQAADEIWLASAWSDWVIDRLPQSLQTLQERYHKPIKIFGRKAFPHLNQKTALALTQDERLAYMRAIPEKARMQNDRMKALLSAYDFVDLMDGYCGGNAQTCRAFSPEGHLISPDGGHLTREGATYLAPVLKQQLERVQ